MEETLLVKELNSCNNLKLNLPDTPDDSRNDKFSINSSSLMKSSEKDDTSDLISNSDEDSSFLNHEQCEGLIPEYICLPSIAKLNKFKQVVSEVNTKYLDWMVSELVMGKYKTICSEVPTPTTTKMKHIITSSTVQPLSVMKNRRGENLTLLGLEEADFETISKKSLLSSEKKELSNKVMTMLKISIQHLSEERDKLKGTFGGHCIKISPPDTVLSEERMQQAQMNEQLRLRLDQGCESLISANQILHQLAYLEADSVRQLQKVSYSSLKDKTKHLCNSMRILRHKMDQISLADVNHTKAMNSVGENLKTSVEKLSERRKRLLKTLEKYERKESASKKFNEIVAEYAKTKRQLNHKLQTLKVLNEPNESFSEKY